MNDYEFLLKRDLPACSKACLKGDVSCPIKDCRQWIDYEEDLEVAKRVFGTIYQNNPDFSFYDLAEFLDKNKEITAINQQRIGINWYNEHLDELKNDPGRHF